MKKSIFLMIAVSFCCTSLFSQIPNNGFENWTTVGSYNLPDNWGTLNNATSSASVFTATKGTPGSPGNSFLKLTSKTVGAGVVNAIAVSGVLDTINMVPKSGFAFNQRPANFKGKWQHMIFGNSQGSINVTLTRWDNGTNSRVTVASANYTLAGMAMSWANFTIPFTFYDGSNPDTCIIVLKASGSSPTENDYLWVDNLMFSGMVSGIENHEIYLNSIHVFPNPSSEKLNISIELLYEQKLNIELLDCIGRSVILKSVKAKTGKSEYALDLIGISKGNYILRVAGEAGNEARNIVIE